MYVQNTLKQITHIKHEPSLITRLEIFDS